MKKTTTTKVTTKKKKWVLFFDGTNTLITDTNSTEVKTLEGVVISITADEAARALQLVLNKKANKEA